MSWVRVPLYNANMPETNAQPAQRPEPPQSLRTRRWKRTAAMMLLLLLGGAVVNVAVAWGCAVFLAETRDGWSGEYGALWYERGAMWSLMRVERSGYIRIESWAGRYLEPVSWDERWKHPKEVIASWSRIPTVTDLESSTNRWIESASGWPFVSMRMRYHATDQSRNFVGSLPVRVLPRDVVVEGVILNSSLLPSSQASIPLRPILSGFILNTLYYALLLWLIFFATFAARRLLRRKRRLCEKCAYPVGVSDDCTECGAAVRPFANENKAAN